VVRGAELAWTRRTESGVCNAAVDLARGPARLAVVLGLDRSDNGTDVVARGGPVSLRLPVEPATEVEVGPRVGVSGLGGSDEHFPWRFWLRGEPTVSDYRRVQ
jgi:DNA-3-methyladenine glycosylase